MYNKSEILFKQEQVLFHTGDLALLWGINNRNTLYTTISRYIKRGTLFPIYKGYYSVVLPEKIKPEQLAAGALNRYCYLSVEFVLVMHGIINQDIKYITFVSDISKNFSVQSHNVKVRKISNQFLFNPSGIRNEGGVKTANIERSVADLIYFNPKHYFDNHKLIDWHKVHQLQKEIGYI